MKYLLILLISACATVPKPKSEADVTWVQGLQATKQETDTWCAVASSQMLMSKFGVFPKQCEIVGKLLGKDCCGMNDLKCFKYHSTVEDVAPLYGFKAKLLPIDFKTVVEKIKAGKAVSIYHWYGSSEAAAAHAVVAYGTYQVDGKDYIVIYDPIGGVKKFWDERWVVGNLAWYRVVEVTKLFLITFAYLKTQDLYPMSQSITKTMLQQLSLHLRIPNIFTLPKRCHLRIFSCGSTPPIQTQQHCPLNIGAG